jgi:hypothetical protein
MKQNITKKGLFVVSAKTIDEKRPQVVALMQRYGMNVKESDGKKKIDMAFLSLLPKSKGFRKDFAKLATPVAEKIHKEYSNMGGYHGFTTELPSGKGLDIKTTAPSAFPTIEAPSGTSSTSKVVKEKSGFGQWLSDTFDAATTQNIINTGLGVWSYQKTGQTTSGGRSILDAARDEMGGTTTPMDEGKQGAKSGLTTTGIVLISVAAIGLIGFAVYKTMKK